MEAADVIPSVSGFLSLLRPTIQLLVRENESKKVEEDKKGSLRREFSPVAIC